jgi:predicted pyridoxine 5'-phosphate oxidase superfamily flavin-nucleotide-binding protein
MTHQQHDTESPFHPGEQQAQDRMGAREKIERVVYRRILDHMPDQHREFYASLPFVLLGSVDDQDRPWASIIAGRPGFMSSPDSYSLGIGANPLFGDPLIGMLKPGTEIGLLGIQPETRRRNRLTGRVRSAGPDGISVDIGQAFGNCPQYIQTRTVELQPGIDAPQTEHPVTETGRFDDDVRALIERSDTLFIATAYLEGPDTVAQGADVSHRGGRPGFVRVEDDRSFVFPDFSGNFHFNTVGNILLNPKAGFLFVDFDSGDLVYTTGLAEIIWDSVEIEAFAGAERLIRFRAEKVIRVEGSQPLRFHFGEYSPMLERTGSWRQTANAN